MPGIARAAVVTSLKFARALCNFLSVDVHRDRGQWGRRMYFDRASVVSSMKGLDFWTVDEA